jgi:hypothetical protein
MAFLLGDFAVWIDARGEISPIGEIRYNRRGPARY